MLITTEDFIRLCGVCLKFQEISARLGGRLAGVDIISKFMLVQNVLV